MKTIGVMVLAVLSFWCPTLEAEAIYWSAWDGTINRSGIDGSGRQTLVSGLQGPNDIALDLAAGTMYWTDVDTGKLQRANLDGSGVTDIITTGLYQPRGMALDVAQGTMYWINGGNDSGQPARIERANLDGTGRQTLVTQSYATSGLFDITLDLAHSKMYFTDFNSDKIERANLDGTDIENVLTGLNDPWGIELDLPNSEIYWTDAGTLNRAKLDGSARETLYSRGSEGLGSLALDLSAGKMYWVNGTDSSIQRAANLDGTSVENVVTAAPFGRFVAMDTTPTAVPLPGSAWAGASLLGAFGAWRLGSRSAGHVEGRGAKSE